MFLVFEELFWCRKEFFLLEIKEVVCFFMFFLGNLCKFFVIFFGDFMAKSP